MRSVTRMSIPGKKNLFEINACLRTAVETSGADRNSQPDDTGQDRYPPHSPELLDGGVVFQLPVTSCLFGVAETRSVLFLSYDFLFLDRLMRTFLGLPLVAAISDVISSTEVTAGTFCSTSTMFIGLRRKTRIKGASI